jgi:hypothetical protein
MNFRIRKEEYTALGDFILPSFIRDQAAIAALFPKFDSAFMDAFTAKLTFVKTLESSLVMTEEQKNATASLYQTAADLNNQLTFLNSYISDAGLASAAVTDLKNDLFSRNIEGAILKTEAVKQYVTSHQTALEDQGMSATFVSTLDDLKGKLEVKNAMQNQYMNSLKKLTEVNGVHYDALYAFISKISAKGKLVFKNTITQDEYAISKNISRMRAAKLKAVEEPK